MHLNPNCSVVHEKKKKKSACVWFLFGLVLRVFLNKHPAGGGSASGNSLYQNLIRVCQYISVCHTVTIFGFLMP